MLFRPTKPLGLAEFTALMALTTATVALSIDAMLPSLPDIAAEFSPHDVNRVQLVLTIFVLGMGAGVLFVGPISDAIGRKATIGWTMGLYILGSVAAVFAQSLEWLLIARFVQGLGVAGPRVGQVLAPFRQLMEAFGGVGVHATTPAELRAAVEEAVRSRKPTLVNAVIDETAGTESGRITSLNPTAAKKK